jgi:hypothetical protein
VEIEERRNEEEEEKKRKSGKHIATNVYNL